MPLTTYTAGEVLTASSLNSNLTAAGGLQFIKSQTIGSAVSSVTVTGAFSSAYDNYRVIVSGGAATTSVALNLILGATSSGYGRQQFLSAYNSSVLTVDFDNFTSPFIAFGGGSVNGLSGTMDIYNPFTASATAFNGYFQQLIAGGTVRTTNGALLNTTSYTAFTLNISTGTMTGGTISVYGYAK